MGPNVGVQLGDVEGTVEGEVEGTADGEIDGRAKKYRTKKSINVETTSKCYKEQFFYF